MCRSVLVERFGVSGRPSLRPVEQQLYRAMREAIVQRAHRRGLTPASIKRRLRARGLKSVCFFFGQ